MLLFIGPMLDSADVTPQDGRVARSHRTRAAIVEALVTLLEEGNPQPTVEEIAAQASVAPRTVFQHYADREALFAAVSAHREAHLQLLMGTIDAAAPLAERIDADRRPARRIFEWIAAVRRGALLMEPFSESVHEALDGFRAAKREELDAGLRDRDRRPSRARARHVGRRARRGGLLVDVGRAAHPAGPRRRGRPPRRWR